MDLTKINRVHFIGIGGIGMSALAKYFLFKGVVVSGYDRLESEISRDLSDNGASIHYEDNVELIDLVHQIDLVVYTPAISDDNLELQYFKANNYILHKRAKVLGDITRSYNTIAVAGTHGKTTTSSIIAHVIHSCNKAGVAFLGGISTNYNSNILLDNGNIAIVEADEYDRSFLQLSPNTIVLTSMDPDHLDVYEKSDNVDESFIEFTNLLNDRNRLIVEQGIDSRFNDNLSYGFNDGAHLKLVNIKIKDSAYYFDILYGEELYQGFKFSLPGKYNLLNAAGAALACVLNGLTFNEIKNGLSSFKGVKRRFEIHFDSEKSTYIDDYAHHPNELKELISAVREFFPFRKIIGVFQPHLYSRTRDFMDEFANELSKLDKLVLLPIYPAREKPIVGINSSVLFDKIQLSDKVLIKNKEDFHSYLLNDSSNVVLTIGAGDIDMHIKEVHNFLKNNA